MLHHAPTTDRRARRSALVSGALVVTLVAVTGCSGDDDESIDTTETTEASAETTTPPETIEAPPETTTPPETTEASAETTTPPETIEAPPETTATPASDGTWTAQAPNMTPVDDATAAEWETLTEDALAASLGTPGVMVAIAHPDLGYWSAAIGEAAVGVESTTLEHHGRIGSVTKTFTAVAILQQVDQGNLNLDDVVVDLVPDLAAQFPEIGDVTIEQLLSMESGLPDYANVPGAATAQAVEDPTKVWEAEDLIEAALGAAEVQPVGTPGYSTTNYAILGLILEELTGEPVEDIVTGVASEAGLVETALLPGEQNDMPEPFTRGYIDEAAPADLMELAGVEVAAGTDVTDWSISWGGAGGGAYSVIEDLFQWTSTGSGNTLLSAEVGEQRLTMDSFLAEAGVAYGMGAMSIIDGWVGHTGQAIGWESFAMYNPDTGATMVFMINSTSGSGPFYSVWDTVFELGLGL